MHWYDVPELMNSYKLFKMGVNKHVIIIDKPGWAHGPFTTQPLPSEIDIINMASLAAITGTIDEKGKEYIGFAERKKIFYIMDTPILELPTLAPVVYGMLNGQVNRTTPYGTLSYKCLATFWILQQPRLFHSWEQKLFDFVDVGDYINERIFKERTKTSIRRV